MTLTERGTQRLLQKERKKESREGRKEEEKGPAAFGTKYRAPMCHESD